MTNGVLAGSHVLAAHGVPGRAGLVYDASEIDPHDWEELEAELGAVFRLTQEAVREGSPIVYVVHEPSIWGHGPPLRAALATALLGGMRSAAVELTRAGLPANVVAVGDGADATRVARAVLFLLDGDLTGQVIMAGVTHLGRPAA